MAADEPRTTRLSRVWYLNGVLAVALVVALPFVVDWPALDIGPRLSWPLVAVVYAVAEAAVLHFRFRRDAHSFSMGEIALTVSLLVASPFHHIIGQAIGNAVAVVANRRQTPVKATFNVAQFTLQTVAALAVFRWVLGDADALDVRGWVACLAGSMAALAVSDVAVNMAIRLSGGAVSATEQWNVRAFSGLAATMNTALGIIIVLVWRASTPALILAVVPPVMLFLAYRAYIGQRADRSRVVELQTAAEGLLGAGTLGDVVRVAAQRVLGMFEVERAIAVVYPLGGSQALWGESRADGSTLAEGVSESRPDVLGGSPRILDPDDVAALGPRFGHARWVLYAPIVRGAEQVGYLLAVQPLSDVSRFGDADIQLISAFAGQVATVVENERLGGAVSALSEMVETKNQVLEAVGHEIRSPLAAMVSAAATLEGRAEQLTSEQRGELVRLIRRNGLELSAIADDLMVAARNEEAPPDLREFDPVPEIRSVAGGMAESGEEIELRGEGCSIWADPTRLRQIVRNLLVNASRYGGDQVWIVMEPRPESFALSVVDDGSGVPEDMREEIFEPYATAHDDVDRPQALGLGLAISRRLARSMGGDVTYSREGGLTRFTVTLPRSPAGGTMPA